MALLTTWTTTLFFSSIELGRVRKLVNIRPLTELYGMVRALISFSPARSFLALIVRGCPWHLLRRCPSGRRPFCAAVEASRVLEARRAKPPLRPFRTGPQASQAPPQTQGPDETTAVTVLGLLYMRGKDG